MNAFTIAILVLIAVIFIVRLGLRVPPHRLPSTGNGQISTSFARPRSMTLPEPVDRFYRRVYFDHIPETRTAVISGQVQMRIAGIWLRGRFRFEHEAGYAYRHYIDATFFGYPFLRIHESYRAGESARLCLPFGKVITASRKIDQAANLALWAEAVWFPSIWLTDERVHWQSIDESTARLRVPTAACDSPAKDGEFAVRFRPDGLIWLMQARRYKTATAAEPELWLVEIQKWGILNWQQVPRVVALSWFDEGTPWAIFETDEVVCSFGKDMESAVSRMYA